MRRPGRLLAFLAALNAVNYLDRYVPAAVLPLVEGDLHLSHRRAGLLGSAFVLVYALASPLAGWIGDRRSRTRLAGSGAILFGLASVGSGVAPGFGWLLAARGATGFGEAGYATVTPSLIADLYPRARRAGALAIFYAALPVGSAAGYLLGGVVGAHLGWRAAFLLAGVPALALGFVLLTIRDPPRGALDAGGGEPARLALLARRPSFFANNAAQVLFTFGLGGLAFWMPSYLHEARGLSLDRAGAAFGALLAAAGFAGTMAGGALAERFGRRSRSADFLVSGGALIAAAPFTAVAVVAPSPVVYWPALFLAAALAFVNTGPLNAALVNVVPAGLRATTIAVNVLVIHLLGDALSPVLLGAIADRAGLAAAVLSVSGVLAAAGGLLVAAAPLLARDLDPANGRS